MGRVDRGVVVPAAWSYRSDSSQALGPRVLGRMSWPSSRPWRIGGLES